jgi:hypothetical protein
VVVHRHAGGNEDGAGGEDRACAGDDAGPGDEDGPWDGVDPARGDGPHPGWSRIREQGSWGNQAVGQVYVVAT